MNSNLEDLYCQLINWLEEPSEKHLSSFEDSGESPSPNLESMTDWDLEQIEALDWEDEDLSQASSDFDDSATMSQPFTMGEIPLVQKRFQALLKRKIQDHIERNPPLFPWESEILEYEPEIQENLIPALGRQLWLPQVASLMPVSIPENVLASLLNACTETMGLVRPQSAKMINAVKDLFPDRAPVLNEIMQRMRLSSSFAPARFSQQEQQKQRQKLAAVLPKDYQQATLQQQMALSLLVAKEILETLTLTVSPRYNTVERLWETSVGVVRLYVHYNPQAQQEVDRVNHKPLRVGVQLPKGGSLTLQADQESITAQRTYAGHLTVEASDLQVGVPYLLEVRLSDPGQMPLKFAIACQPD